MKQKVLLILCVVSAGVFFASSAYGGSGLFTMFYRKQTDAAPEHLALAFQGSSDLANQSMPSADGDFKDGDTTVSVAQADEVSEQLAKPAIEPLEDTEVDQDKINIGRARSRLGQVDDADTTAQEVNNLRQEKAALESAQDKLINQVVGYSREVRKLKATLAQKDRELESRASELKNAESAMREKASGLEERVGNSDRLRQNLDKAVQRLTELQARNKELTENLNTTSEKLRVTKLEADQSAERVAAESEKLRGHLEGLLTKYKELLTVKTANDESLSKANEQLALLSAAKRELEERLSDSETKAAERADNIVSMKEQLTQVSKAVNECKADLVSTTEQASRVTKLAADIKQCSARTSELEKTVSDMAQLKSELAKKTDALIMAQNQMILMGSQKDMNKAVSDTQPALNAASRIAPEDDKLDVKADVPVAPEMAEFRVKVRTDIRREPALSAAVIGYLNKGMVVKAEASRGEWYRIVTPRGVKGYVRMAMVESMVDTQTQNAAGKTVGDSRSVSAEMPMDDSELIVQPTGKPKKPAARVVKDDALFEPFGDVGQMPAPTSAPRFPTTMAPADYGTDDATAAFESLKREMQHRPQ